MLNTLGESSLEAYQYTTDKKRKKAYHYTMNYAKKLILVPSPTTNPVWNENFPHPYEFPHSNPTRSSNLVRTFITPHTTKLNIHHNAIRLLWLLSRLLWLAKNLDNRSIHNNYQHFVQGCHSNYKQQMISLPQSTWAAKQMRVDHSRAWNNAL